MLDKECAGAGRADDDLDWARGLANAAPLSLALWLAILLGGACLVG